MASNDGKRGFFAGADTFKPAPDAQQPIGNRIKTWMGPGVDSVQVNDSSDAPALYEEYVSSTGRTVTQDAPTGARNNGKGCSGYTPPMVSRKA